MVKVIYRGRLGNNLFQYCMGRILATELGYVLEADSIPGFLRTRDDVRGKDYSSKRKQILEGHTIDLQKILSDKSKRQIVIDYGFFQRYEYFRPYKAQIKKWMKPSFESIAKVASQDVVLCIRRDDYVPDNALPLSYYEEALSKIDYKKLYLCTDSVDDSFIEYFKVKYGALVKQTDAYDSFAFIRKFSKIIISNSSFYWWAAFLSKAKTIIYPLPKKGYWSRDWEIDLAVDDEERYQMISCKSAYKYSLAEKIINSNAKLLRKIINYV